MKILGLALLVATAAPSAFATVTYTEVWNPPEARATTSRHVTAAQRFASHQHAGLHPVKVHARRVPTPTPSLMAKQPRMLKAAPTNEPDTSDIPRQITPEGNVLRVTARGTSAEVFR